MTLTVVGIKAQIAEARRKGVDKTLRESRGRGRGGLMLRIKADKGSVPRWYFVYTLDRKMKAQPIGAFGDGPGEFTLERARQECGRLDALRVAIPGGDLHGQLRIEQAAAAATHRREVKAAQNATEHTLHALMDAYADWLEARGKGASRDVRSLTRNHLAAFPEYAEAPACELGRRQAVEIIRRVVERGNGRTAAKLRSYMRAAFAVAMRAESDPAAPAKMLGFQIESNPIADTAALPQFNRIGERALSEKELRYLWARLKATETPSARAVRLSLLLGGQRFEQLLRVRVADFDAEALTLTLWDRKGRRTAPRAHVLPLPKAAATLVSELSVAAGAAKAEFLFPADNERSLDPRTVSKYLQPVRTGMVAAGEAEAFKLADLRRTCETRLAELGVSKEIRAQIQSHGLGGVQARHYDRYEYMREKRQALESWEAWLTAGVASNVVAIKKRRASKATA